MMSLSDRIRLLNRSPFWAIMPDVLANLVSLVVHGQGEHLPTSGPQTWRPNLGAAGWWGWEATKPAINGTKQNKVLVIPIEGVLTKDGPSWLGNTYDQITSAAEKAGTDPDVKRVVLAVDSPGGEVVGLPETATVLSQVAKVKPVSAIVHGMSASAAYWLTGQSSEIALTPSGEVGSVGVRMMHADVSKMLDDIGVKITELYSGEYKNEWSPFKPLTEDAKADMQRRLVSVHQDFLSALDNGRGNRASAEIRQARYGEGRMFSATDAMGHGLVDRVQAPRDFWRAVTPAQEEEPAPAFPIGPRKARLGVERNRF